MAAPFGPSALATPANLITVVRLLVSPLLAVLIVSEGPSWALAVVWLVLCVSDGIDGHLARRQGATRSGAFLDPLADKVQVLGAMFALVVRGTFPWLPVAIITVREVAISWFRSSLGRQGVSLPARRTAKYKTVAQQVAIGLAIVPLTADLSWLWLSLLWLAVVLALVSMVDYLFARPPRAPTEG